MTKVADPTNFHRNLPILKPILQLYDWAMQTPNFLPFVKNVHKVMSGYVMLAE